MSDVTGGSLVSSSSTLSAHGAFNLHDEKNAVALLRKIHQSPISPDDKNELRDAVFVFRNNPTSEITPEFTEKFAEFGFTLSADVQVTASEKGSVSTPTAHTSSRLGTTRPSPVFSGVATQQAEIAVEESQIVSPETTPLTEEVISETTSPTTEASVSEPFVATTSPVTDVPVTPMPTAVESVAAESSTAPPAPEPVVTPTTEPTTSTEAPTAAAPAAVTSTTLERIKEIKKEVNLLVGNPVNLIDVHNDIGREYMNALLDAMKKNNGGSSEQVNHAMTRLEAAFIAVKETVGATGVAAPEQPTTPEVSEEPPVVVLEEVPVTPEPLATPAASATVQSTHTEQGASEHTVTQSQAGQKADTSAPVAVASEPEVSASEEESASAPAEVPAPELEAKKISDPADPLVKKQEESVPSESIETAETQSSVHTTGGIMSVAKVKQIQDLMTTQKQEAATTDQQKEDAKIASMDPLMTPDVTNGLQQLLSEWSLFKSSGIFGTGASGMDHPLYKKLAALNMTAVVAGRYEGATPQIKRSITDYMNGWRYEEGILQTQGELFEHYLRRVIKHILDKRSAGTPPVK